MTEREKGKAGERALGFLERLRERGEKMQERGRERIREGLRSDPKKAPTPSEEQHR